MTFGLLKFHVFLAKVNLLQLEAETIFGILARSVENLGHGLTKLLELLRVDFHEGK